MATTKGAASAAPSRSNGAGKKSKAKAAVEETGSGPKRVEFHGVTLEVAEAPPRTFMWDIAAAQNNLVAYYELTQSLIAPEQLSEVRSVIATSTEDVDVLMRDLIDGILGVYGIGLGESSASQES